MELFYDFKMKTKIINRGVYDKKPCNENGFNGYGKIRGNGYIPYGIFAKYNNIQCVYSITNTITKLSYIGSTTNFGRRLNKHFSELHLNRHTNESMQNDYNKYGFSSFKFDILEEVYNQSDLLAKEKEYQIKCGIANLYNLKISGYYMDDALKAKYGNCDKSVYQTEEYKQKMRKLKINKIGKFNLKFELIKIYDSVDEASNENNLAKSTILGCCNRSKKQACGHIYRYMDKDNNVINKGKGITRIILVRNEDIVYST